MTARAIYPGPDQLRLWSSSALAALAAHLALAMLLFAHWHWHELAPAGSPAGTLDVELTSLAAPAAPTPTAQRPPKPSPLQFKPLSEVPALTVQTQPAAEQPARPPTAPVQTLSPAEPDLTVSAAPPGEADVSQNPANLWNAEVRSQLQRHIVYPRRAVRRKEQDSITLLLSIDRAGRVSYYRIDSKHRYVDLEQEVLNALRLAAPFPPPPASVPLDAVLRLPVSFSLQPAKTSTPTTACSQPPQPGQGPSGAVATLEQMRSYQQTLNHYVTAIHGYLACLEHGTTGAPAGSTVSAAAGSIVAQVNSLVEHFNAQARLFKATAEAQVLKAQQQAARAAAARLAQAQAAAAAAYAACPAPSAHARPPAITSLTADEVPAYGRRLIAYDAVVHAYVSCIEQAHRTVLAQAGSGLDAAQRSALDRDAAAAGNAAVAPLNQLIVAFNSQLQGLQQQARATRAALAAFAARSDAQAALIAGTWDTPAPLPQGECVRIERAGRRYRGSLCGSIYAAPVSSSSVADELRFPGARGLHSVSYTLVNLQVAGAHVSFTIERHADGAQSPMSADDGNDDWTRANFDLTLSADGKHLTGQCWTQQIHRKCQLPRHR